MHLHLHTEYSLLDGAIRIAALPAALQSKGFTACAITDHGNLFGAVEFYSTLKKAGLKAIIGVEAYVADGSRTKRGYPRPGPNANHLVLLCQNRVGYQNLIRLVSLAYTEGKYFGFPRMDRDLLEQHHEGLIALSSCLSGVVNRPLGRGDEAEARRRGEDGFRFFGYGLGHHYIFGSHKPGRTNIWERFEQARPGLPEAGSSRGIGTPQQLREHLRSFEETGVDQVIFIQQSGRNRHEHICESLELFGRQVLPGFKERSAGVKKQKDEELAPYLEAALARKKWMQPLADSEIPVVPALGRQVIASEPS